MTDRIPKRERLLNLAAALLAAKRPLPFSAIAGRVRGYEDRSRPEALEKRLDRDRAELRRLGLPIEFVPGDLEGEPGFVIRPERAFQKRTRFLPEEAALLRLAGRLGAEASGELRGALETALRKLAADLPGIPREEDGPGFLIHPGGSLRPEAWDRVRRLAEAILDHAPVAFKYRRTGTAGARTRRVDPYGLAWRGGALYLAGRCHERNAVRVFKIARMEGAILRPGGKARSAGPTFQVPAGFDLAQALAGADPAAPGPVEVEGLATEAVLEARPTLEKLGRSGDRWRFRGRFQDLAAVARFALGEGPEVELTRPPAARQAVRRAASRLAQANRPRRAGGGR
jgi:proteasome accessory factor B